MDETTSKTYKYVMTKLLGTLVAKCFKLQICTINRSNLLSAACVHRIKGFSKKSTTFYHVIAE